MYLDANNLYGWAMSQKLQVKSFKWKKICQNLMESLQKGMIKIVTTRILQGYILEIDVEYPKRLHNI